MEILSVKNLSFRYPGQSTDTLSDISFSLSRGEFLAVAGPTGCGKTTLLRLLKKELSPRGELRGEISISGSVGYVNQMPEEQIVTDKVWHEIAFGGENLGYSPAKIARKSAEIAEYFGIESLYDRPCDTLSGGEKQLVTLAGVMITDPDILILDEPTARLDPVAASDFLSVIKKLCLDFDITVILCEHRLENVIPLCDRVLYLEKGHIAALGDPASVMNTPGLLPYYPVPARLAAHREGLPENPPFTIREGRRYLEKHLPENLPVFTDEPAVERESALEFSGVYARYNRKGADVLENVSFSVGKGEIFCIVGANGSGKSSTLKCASGILKPYLGKIKVFGQKSDPAKGQIAALPQDPTLLFLKNTVKEELSDTGAKRSDYPFLQDIPDDIHPYDLSGGQRQLLGLAKVLACHPKILLLDEPTKGLDPEYTKIIGDLLTSLAAGGMTIVLVCHDPEFAADYAHRIALFFGGRLLANGSPREFFSDASFYTTAAAKMAGGLIPGCVSFADLVGIFEEGEKC